MDNNELLIIIISFIVGYLVSKNNMCRLIEGSDINDPCKGIDLKADPCNSCNETNQWSDEGIAVQVNEVSLKAIAQYNNAKCKWEPDAENDGSYDNKNSICPFWDCTTVNPVPIINDSHYRYGYCPEGGTAGEAWLGTWSRFGWFILALFVLIGGAYLFRNFRNADDTILEPQVDE